MSTDNERPVTTHIILPSALWPCSVATRPLFFFSLVILFSLLDHSRGGQVATLPEADMQPAPPPVTDKCWIFTHLQKCGGSTVKRILHDSWGSKFTIYDSPQWKAGDAFTQLYAQKVASGAVWNVVAGGYPEALRRTAAADDTCTWFIVFRHPISRLVSAFYYCREAPGDWACAYKVVDAREVDLVAFAKHWGNFALRQFALSMVPADAVKEHLVLETGRNLTAEYIKATPGWYLLKMYLDDQAGASGYGQIPDAAMYEMLRPAQDLLRDSYAAVGILEEFNTTLSLFSAALEMPMVDWHSVFERDGVKNVDEVYKREEEEALVEAWTNSEIKSYLHLDLLLYEHAVDVFHKQTKLYGLV